MTRQGVINRLTRCAMARGRAWPEPQTAYAGCSQAEDCLPSTSYSLSTPSPTWRFRSRGSIPTNGHAYCSWPAAASQPQPPQSSQTAHFILNSDTTSDYERRLHDFLSASSQASAAEPTSPQQHQTQQRQPPDTSSSTVAAIRARAHAALQRVPPFNPLHTTPATPTTPGRCSSGPSRSPFSNGSTTQVSISTLPATSSAPGPSSALPHPRPHSPPAPAPAPASPQPLDWRELLHRARQAAPGQQAPQGAAMLTDKFSRTHTYLRISLTERCNLRCSYCMPEQGVDLTPGGQLLTTGELLRLARLFVDAGVSKIRLTGGEPTLRRDLTTLMGQLGELRPMGLRHIGLTSNGLVLGRQLPELKEAGLTAVNISLDTLRPERFLQLARRPGHGRVMEAIRTALGLGYDPVKVNVVVMRGVNDDEVADFAALTADQPINVRFIEYMPFDGNVWSDNKMVPYRELVSRIEAAFPATPLERLEDPRGEVAKNFRLRGHRGTVSFITSMTQHFCSDCNRLRLLADGSLKVCLFGASEVSLRDAVRGGVSDEELRTIIAAAVGRKRAAHAGMLELAATTNRPMITIGG